MAYKAFLDMAKEKLEKRRKYKGMKWHASQELMDWKQSARCIPLADRHEYDYEVTLLEMKVLEMRLDAIEKRIASTIEWEVDENWALNSWNIGLLRQS